MTDYREEDKCFTEERCRVKETALTFFCSFFCLLCSDEETLREKETKKNYRKSKDRDKSVAICYDFKLIKELVVR